MHPSVGEGSFLLILSVFPQSNDANGDGVCVCLYLGEALY